MTGRDRVTSLPLNEISKSEEPGPTLEEKLGLPTTKKAIYKEDGGTGKLDRDDFSRGRVEIGDGEVLFRRTNGKLENIDSMRLNEYRLLATSGLIQLDKTRSGITLVPMIVWNGNYVGDKTRVIEITTEQAGEISKAAFRGQVNEVNSEENQRRG